MKQLFLETGGHTSWREVAAPQLQEPTDALVRPMAVAICDADRAAIRRPGAAPEAYPIGHEFVGEVTEVGDAVVGLPPGTIVVSSFKISCGSCGACRRGATTACTTVPPRSAFGFSPERHGTWGGALSDCMRVPYANHLLREVPSTVKLSDVAPAGDNLSDAYRTVAPGLFERPGAPVLVVAGAGGAPSIGLYAVDVATALGSERVLYVDRDPERLRLAEGYGADVLEASTPPGEIGRFPITVDANGDPKGEWLGAVIRSTEPFGLCTSVGIYGDTVPMPLNHMYHSGIRFFTGWVNVPPILDEVLSLLASGSIDPGRIHSVIDWKDAVSAIPTTPTKLVLTRNADHQAAPGVMAL